MTRAPLCTILPVTGWSDERARAVEFTGGTSPSRCRPFSSPDACGVPGYKNQADFDRDAYECERDMRQSVYFA
jgi:hypothetical protein